MYQLNFNLIIMKKSVLTTGIGALVLAILFSFDGKEKNEKRIQNNYEWDPLTEVVIGRWVPGTYEVVEVDLSVKDHFPYINEKAWGYMKSAEKKMLNEVYPEDDMEYYEEQENFAKLLESMGIKVRRPDEMEFHSPITAQNYSRDPIITIGDKFIIANLYNEHRRKETASYRRIALELAKNYQGEVVDMPANKEGFHPDNVYLEGGDVFVNGSEVYVGISGNATNQAGIEWLRKELGEAYTVYAIPLEHHVLHLDCAMMLINEKQGIICKEDFSDFENLPTSLKGYKWVEVKPEEAQLMATNGVVINSKTIIMSDAFPHVAKQVREMGIEVHEIPFKKANYFGGGLRCSYQPIHRK